MLSKDHISICICTYKRPDRLAHLLRTLESQKTENLFDFSIVVVDNDFSESARLTVELCSSRSNLAIKYFIEPEQNIALARNKAVEKSTGDFVAFIDDDEFPADDWLLKLYGTLQDSKSDGILGPVVPYFEVEPPNWVIAGKFFHRPRHQTGHLLGWQDTRTGNALLRKHIFFENNHWFDPSFGSGGEDRDFFRRSIKAGRVFRWNNDACVYEIVPPERWKRKTLLKRALLRGKVANQNSSKKTSDIIKSVLAIPIYTISLPFSLLFGAHFFVRTMIKNCDHIGKVLAFLHIDVIREKYIIS